MGRSQNCHKVVTCHEVNDLICLLTFSDGANFPKLEWLGLSHNKIEDAGWKLKGVFKEVKNLVVNHVPLSEAIIGLDKLGIWFNRESYFCFAPLGFVVSCVN